MSGEQRPQSAAALSDPRDEGCTCVADRPNRHWPHRIWCALYVLPYHLRVQR